MALNALKYNWCDDVAVILFGPIERAIAEGDETSISFVKELADYGKVPVACKRIAEMEGIEEKLEKLTRVEYVGSIIAEYIEKGYVPMNF